MPCPGSLASFTAAQNPGQVLRGNYHWFSRTLVQQRLYLAITAGVIVRPLAVRPEGG